MNARGWGLVAQVFRDAKSRGHSYRNEELIRVIQQLRRTDRGLLSQKGYGKIKEERR